MTRWIRPQAALASVFLLSCASPGVSSLRRCDEHWSLKAVEEAVATFDLDQEGNPRKNLELYHKLDQLDAYCLSANEALRVKDLNLIKKILQ